MKSRQTHSNPHKLPFSLSLLFTIPLALTTPVSAATLAEIYQIAVERDSVIQASKAQYEAAIQAVPLARSANLPQVALAGNTGRNDLNDDGDGTFESNSLGASISQNVFDLTVTRSIKRAKISVAQAEATLKEAEQSLMFRTAQAYFNVLTAREAFRAAASSREAIAQQTEQAERRFDVGLSAVTDVKEAQAQLDLAVAAEVVAENQVALAREALRVIINQDVPPLAGLKDDATLTAPVPASVEDWMNVAEENSPALNVARKDFELAEADIRIERARRLPTVAITGGLSLIHI